MDTTTIKKQVLDAYKFRHACKIFDADKKIPDENFSFILKTAHSLDTDKYGVACMAGFGYRIKQPRDKTRQDFGDIVKTI